MDATVFESQRSRLMAIAYRMLGSVAEAEDVLQEAYLRWTRADAEQVRSPPAFLTRVVTRLCLDQLKAARARRETYPGPWLPEPLVTGASGGAWGGAAEGAGSGTAGRTAVGTEPADPGGPWEQASRRESVSLAFLVLLERLAPAERAVYLLREVFEEPYAEIARTLEKDEAACRQLHHRAARHLAEGKPRFAPSAEAHARILTAFLEACGRDDVETVQRLLASDARAVADGGGRATAATRPVEGAHAVSRLVLGLAKKGGVGASARFIEVNGWPAVYFDSPTSGVTITSIETDGEKIYTLFLQRNPDKLRHLTA